jgi:GH25 family lysozyme M1 (1,4-beta-N-acetylmuramidase)
MSPALLELGDEMGTALAQPMKAGAANTYLPDISEFQANVNFAQLNAWNGGAAIIRAAYGAGHVDRAWYGGARRDAFWKNGGKVLGIYQYLVASQDAAAQANALAHIIGALRKNEFVICDLEEGGGDQLARWQTWQHIINAHLGYSGYTGAWLYSGDYFFRSHGLMPVADSKVHTWVAAYQGNEPTDVPHALWQESSHASVPGVGSGVDLSVYPGSIAQLRTLVAGAAPTPPRPAPPKPAPPRPVVDRHRIKLVQGALGLHQDGFWWHGTDTAFLHERARARNHFGVDVHRVIGLQHAVGVRGDGDWGNNTDKALMNMRAADLNK